MNSFFKYIRYFCFFSLDNQVFFNKKKKYYLNYFIFRKKSGIYSVKNYLYFAYQAQKLSCEFLFNVLCKNKNISKNLINFFKFYEEIEHLNRFYMFVNSGTSLFNFFRGTNINYGINLIFLFCRRFTNYNIFLYFLTCLNFKFIIFRFFSEFTRSVQFIYNLYIFFFFETLFFDRKTIYNFSIKMYNLFFIFRKIREINNFLRNYILVIRGVRDFFLFLSTLFLRYKLLNFEKKNVE